MLLKIFSFFSNVHVKTSILERPIPFVMSIEKGSERIDLNLHVSEE